MNTTEAAKAIRVALKSELGLSAKQVSVRSDLYSGGSTIRVTIKVPGVSRAKVEAIANGFSRVSRCEVTGEILSGGNRFVSVDVADEVHAERIAELAPVLEALEVRGYFDAAKGVSVRRDDRYEFTVFAAEGDETGNVRRAWGAASAARVVAEVLNERIAKGNEIAREMFSKESAA